jgi:putative SOS response-associated peptidase YedK
VTPGPRLLYEWKRSGSIKQPFLIRRRDKAAIAFAGLWERWQGHATEKPLETFTIVTTAANELMRPIHGKRRLSGTLRAS